MTVVVKLAGPWRWAVALFLLGTMSVASGCAGPAPVGAGETEPQKLDRLVAALRVDRGGNGHPEYTETADELVAVGRPAIGAVLPVFVDGDGIPRLIAANVVYRITLNEYGWVQGRGWPPESRELEHRAFWDAMGGLDDESDREEREASAARWRRWLATGEIAPLPPPTTRQLRARERDAERTRSPFDERRTSGDGSDVKPHAATP